MIQRILDKNNNRSHSSIYLHLFNLGLGPSLFLNERFVLFSQNYLSIDMINGMNVIHALRNERCFCYYSLHFLFFILFCILLCISDEDAEKLQTKNIDFTIIIITIVVLIKKLLNIFHLEFSNDSILTILPFATRTVKHNFTKKVKKRLFLQKDSMAHYNKRIKHKLDLQTNSFH
jgi:hypothetical protein